MPSIWDPKGRRVVDENGAFTYIAFLLNAEQVNRWVSYGFDLAGAALRNKAAVRQFRAATDAAAAHSALRQHFASEYETAIAEGVPADDPDIYLFHRAPKAFEWEPPDSGIALSPPVAR